ncbi:MAG: dicarboxylate/amino acid:cation symporter [Patulibacter sp.]
MNPTWSTLGPLAAVAVSWAAIWWLRKRQLNFSLVTLFALAIGIPIGLLAGQHVDAIAPIGRIYINVLLAVVGPLILVAIISSISSLGSLVKLRSIGLRSVFWLLLSNALGVAIAIGLALALQPGRGTSRELGTLSTDTIQGQVQGFGDVVVGFFPTNVIQNFGANDIIPIILIAVTLSVAYLALAEKEPAKARPFAVGAEALKLVIFKAVGYVIRLTPYAIVALTAGMVGSSTNLGDDFRSLGGLLALVWIACLIHTYIVNGALLSAFANVPVGAFFRKIFPAQLTAFSTQSSVGTLPVTTSLLTGKVGVHPEIAHFTAPLGTTIGMPGCAGIWPVLIAVWGINAYGLAYSPADYALLALLSVIVSVGVAGVPGAATVSAATVMAAANLPLEFVAATISIGVIADMARTATNVTAAAVSATIVARQTGLLDDEIFAGRKEFVEEAPIADGADPVPPTAAPQPAFPAPAPADVPTPAYAGAPATDYASAASTATYAQTPAAPDVALPAWSASTAGQSSVPRVFWGTTELSLAPDDSAPTAPVERQTTPA